MATRYDLTGTEAQMRGDTPTFTIETPDLNIAGYTFRLTVKELDDETNDDTQALMSVSWNAHLNNYETAVTLSSGQTNFAPGIYKYDIQASKSPTVHTIIYGEWEQLNDITKTT